jgi:hypothetical protein
MQRHFTPSGINAIGFSPFSIESTIKPGTEPIGKAYEIINQLAGEIAAAKKRKSIGGFY